MGKVLLSTELSLLALTSIPGWLMGDFLCELSAEGKFSTCPERPHTGSAVSHGVEVNRATTNSAPLEGAQEGVCLLWDGHSAPGTSTVMAGEQRGLQHQSCKPTSLETSAAEDLGSPFQLSEHLKPRELSIRKLRGDNIPQPSQPLHLPEIPAANPSCRQARGTSHARNFGVCRRTPPPFPKSRRVLAALLPPAAISSFVKVRKSSASCRL